MFLALHGTVGTMQFLAMWRTQSFVLVVLETAVSFQSRCESWAQGPVSKNECSTRGFPNLSSLEKRHQDFLSFQFRSH
jgi:hypothetical protein